MWGCKGKKTINAIESQIPSRYIIELKNPIFWLVKCKHVIGWCQKPPRLPDLQISTEDFAAPNFTIKRDILGIDLIKVEYDNVLF